MEKIRVRKAESTPVLEKRGEMDQLVEDFRKALDILMPLEDRPHEYLLYAGCAIREHFKQPDVRVSMNIHGFTTNFWRASNAVLEALVVNNKVESGKLAVYLTMPGDVDGSEKSIMHHVRMFSQDFTPDYSYMVLALFRQPIAKLQYPDETRILGSRLNYVGDYHVNFSEMPNYRLYICGFGMTFGSLDLEPYN